MGMIFDFIESNYILMIFTASLSISSFYWFLYSGLNCQRSKDVSERYPRHERKKFRGTHSSIL